MRLILTSLVLMQCIGAVYSLALTSPSYIDGQLTAERWIQYDLTPSKELGNTTTNDNSLTIREDVTVCERAIAAVAGCVVITNILITWVTTVGSSIKSLSDQGSCGVSSGALDGISWVYYSSGSNCDTTAEAATIQGALEQHLKSVDGSSLCYNECLDLTHSGTWNGWLLIGPTATFDSSLYCGPTLSFTSCTSGGKNDLG